MLTPPYCRVVVVAIQAIQEVFVQQSTTWSAGKCHADMNECTMLGTTQLTIRTKKSR
jgi:hypothetical protein